MLDASIDVLRPADAHVPADPVNDYRAVLNAHQRLIAAAAVDAIGATINDTLFAYMNRTGLSQPSTGVAVADRVGNYRATPSSRAASVRTTYGVG